MLRQPCTRHPAHLRSAKDLGCQGGPPAERAPLAGGLAPAGRQKMTSVHRISSRDVGARSRLTAATVLLPGRSNSSGSYLVALDVERGHAAVFLLQRRLELVRALARPQHGRRLPAHQRRDAGHRQLQVHTASSGTDV